MTQITLIVFIVTLFISIPIGVSIGLANIVPGLVNPSFPGSVDFVIRGMVSGVDNTPILAIPLFILSGAIMSKGGISKKLFNVFSYFIGDKTAGMPIAVIITCLFYGAISGSGIATTAAVGSMTIPLLISLGYDKVFSAAVVATAGGLGVIIPPSIPFVMYGLTTGVSVGDMFTAGIIPGCLIALCLTIYAYIYCKRTGEDKEKIHASVKELRDQGFIKVFIDSIWALLTPVIILGGIYSGITTPTEAANISVIYSIIVCVFIYKTVKPKEVVIFLRDTVVSTAPLSVLLALSIVFGRVLTLMKAPDAVGEFILNTFPDKIGLLIALNILFLILGCFMDVGPAIVIFAPMLLPTAIKLGIDPVHLGIIMVVNLAIGFVTPPFGVNLFVAAPLIKTPVMEVGKKAIPFIISFLVALALITFIPELSLALLNK